MVHVKVPVMLLPVHRVGHLPGGVVMSRAVTLSVISSISLKAGMLLWSVRVRNRRSRTCLGLEFVSLLQEEFDVYRLDAEVKNEGLNT
jgi:hypothetical protein